MNAEKSKIPDFILEQELDEIPSYCRDCGKVHGTEACTYGCELCGEDPCICGYGIEAWGQGE